MNELLSRHERSAQSAGVNPISTVLLEGGTVDGLLGFLDERRPDLMVLGARGLSPTRRLLLGSVSDGVLHHATCSILIVRSPSPDPPPESG